VAAMKKNDQTVSALRVGTDSWAPRDVAEPTTFHTTCRALQGERGQASVEFGLVVPLVCFLIWTLVQFGLALNYWLDTTQLANQGARLAAVIGNTDSGGNFKSWVQQQALTTDLRNGTGDVSQAAKVCVSFPNGTTPAIGDPVRVTVTAKYHWIPFISAADFNISSSSTMRLEQLPTFGAGCYP
jgi:Flp pilus assembly protein TadG